MSAFDPWVRYRGTGLYAVPSIHYRQVFGQLVFEACRRKRFDVIAVELPPSLQDKGIIEAALRLAPAPGMVIYPNDEKVIRMRVPKNGDPTLKEREMRTVKGGLMFPFTPCDSIIMALRCPQLLAPHWPDWAPEVALIDDESREGERARVTFPFRDDYEVIRHGLAAFQERMSETFHRSRSLPVDDVREQVMASRLRKFLEEGKEVLFVCGAAHWRSICAYLDAGGPAVAAERLHAPPHRIILAPFEPAVAWFWGWLDDFPRVGWEMELACQRNALAAFDKRTAVHALVAETFGEALGKELPTSIRRLQKMERYVQTVASAAGRWIPELDGHLIPAAAACVEGRFAELLKKKALEFPAPLPEGVEMARVIQHHREKWLIFAGDEVFLVELPKSEGKTGERRIALPMPAPLTGKERKKLNATPKNPRSHGRDWPEEVFLAYMMDERARELAARRNGTSFSRRFTGSMADGPDWRRTIRARAGGDRSIYIRQTRTHVPNRAHGPGKVVTPVVWIFDDQARVIDINWHVAFLADGTRLAQSILYICEQSKIAEDRIRVDKVAAFVDLGHGRTYAGKAQRWNLSGEEEKALDTKYLESIPAEKRCNFYEWRTCEEQMRFEGVDHAVATGVRFAGDRLILVSRSSQPLPERVRQYAKEKGVEIQRVSIDHFGQERLTRFRYHHWAPYHGTTGYEPPYEWCARFIPPI